MLDKVPGIEPKFQKWMDDELRNVATSGYTLLLQKCGTLIGHMYTTSDRRWVRSYLSNQLWLVDPVIRFAYGESGMATLSEIKAREGSAAPSIEDLCARHGLRYGTVIVKRRGDDSNCALVANRADRELSVAENHKIADVLTSLLKHLDLKMGLSDADIAMLRLLSNGWDQETVAYRMSVSRETVKKRIDRVRRRFGARNATHAVCIAIKNNLLG